MRKISLVCLALLLLLAGAASGGTPKPAPSIPPYACEAIGGATCVATSTGADINTSQNTNAVADVNTSLGDQYYKTPLSALRFDFDFRCADGTTACAYPSAPNDFQLEVRFGTPSKGVGTVVLPVGQCFSAGHVSTTNTGCAVSWYDPATGQQFASSWDAFTTLHPEYTMWVDKQRCSRFSDCRPRVLISYRTQAISITNFTVGLK